jgi:hypothetical protein
MIGNLPLSPGVSSTTEKDTAANRPELHNSFETITINKTAAATKTPLKTCLLAIVLLWEPHCQHSFTVCESRCPQDRHTLKSAIISYPWRVAASMPFKMASRLLVYLLEMRAACGNNSEVF